MTSRITTRNFIKVAAVVLFLPLISILVLIIGLGAKNRKVIFEGGIYTIVFIIALLIPGDLAALVGIGSMTVSVVRSVMLRDLWLAPADRNLETRDMSQYPEQKLISAPVETTPFSSKPVKTPANLSNVLTELGLLAKQNKHRLPAETYVMTLETCQILDAVINAENRQSSEDAEFEYELEAVVCEYLPAVLRGYLAIPITMVEKKQPNGKTANEELVEQLNLLQEQSESLYAARNQHTSAGFSTTGNFLRERFGHYQKDRFDFGIK
ncbi:hypothetical protein ACTXL8_08900 [Glutamicibacter arilaitensis]|uniref:hypothetical protein n=1 Tax=Glutamicibacter arilaitensis TaxID=256701 RepID=UPI003FD4B90A